MRPNLQLSPLCKPRDDVSPFLTFIWYVEALDVAFSSITWPRSPKSDARLLTILQALSCAQQQSSRSKQAKTLFLAHP